RFDEGAGALVATGKVGSDDARLWRQRGAGADRLHRLQQLRGLRMAAARERFARFAGVEFAGGGGVDDADCGRAIFDQRDVDGELIAAFGEAACAVEWIDAKEA